MEIQSPRIEDSDSDDNYDCVSRTEQARQFPLTEPVTLKQLTNSRVIEIEPAYDDATPESVYTHCREDAFEQSVKADYLGDDSDEEALEQTIFSQIAKKMDDVTDDGGVKKMIIKPGSGNVLSNGDRVKIHYVGFLEYHDEPFDSTRLRNRMKVLRVGNCDVIEGLDIAVSTMKKGELSKFLIQPQYAFGSMGSTPRVPKDAPVLFEVEVIDFADLSDALPEEKDALGFEKVYKHAKACRAAGNTKYNDKNFREAIKEYRKGVFTLDKTPLHGEREEDECHELMASLKINLAQCYLKLREPKRACLQCKDVIELPDTEPLKELRTKAIFRKGKALVMLSDFVQAEKLLYEARRRAPGDTVITNEIEILRNKKYHSERAETDMYQRMFGNVKKAEDPKPSSSVSEELQNIIREEMENFLKDDSTVEQLFPLAANMSEENLIVCHEMAESLGIDFHEDRRNAKTIYRLGKQQQQK